MPPETDWRQCRGRINLRGVDSLKTPVAWPLFDLILTTPRLQLRYASDADLQTLAGFRREGMVISKGEEPFDGDSTFYMDSPEAQRKALMGERGARARTDPDWWHLSFAVVAHGSVIGQQNITGIEFRQRRTVNSFSYLARTHQGQGLGREMRSAVLQLAFELGAMRAESDAFADNGASLGVSRALGYQPNGSMISARPSGGALMLRLVLTRDLWEATRRPDVRISGLGPCLSVLGLDDSSGPSFA
jgi:RimJ/RimL family protein N-acetyltransferase